MACSAGSQTSGSRCPPQEKVEIVVEGHADTAMKLHAVLHQLAAVVADVELAGAHQLRLRRCASRLRPPRR